jgi:hypothetical protein
MMVKSMSEALKVPHFGYSDEMEMSSTMEMKKEVHTAITYSHSLQL